MTKLPNFSDEQEEAEFWATHDSTNYFSQSKPVDMIFRDARPPKEQIPLNPDTATIGVILELPETQDQQ